MLPSEVLRMVEQVVGGERLANDADGQAADEFGIEAELDEIAGLGLFEGGGLAAGQGQAGGAEADGGGAEAALHQFFQAVKGAADDEEDVAGADGGGLVLAVSGEVHHGLDLAADVVGGAGGNLGFFQEFEQVGLDAAAADVAPVHVGGAGDFINFVNVDDAVLGFFDIAVGAAEEFADQVFDVGADVAGFGEFGGVALDEGDADEVGGVANEVGFADAGGADQDDVLLGVIGGVLAGAGQADVMIVVAQGDAEDFFGLLLFDDEAVEEGLDLAGSLIKEELVLGTEREAGIRERRRVRLWAWSRRPGAGA